MHKIKDLWRRAVVPLYRSPRDYDPVLEAIGDSETVLLGEATHGTHEFYAERAEITKRLIRERHFNVIAIEGDWPDAYRVNRFVRGQGHDQEAVETLGGFRRFPTWMWRNADVLDFVGWLRTHNDALPCGNENVSFLGLDLYSLHSSVAAVIDYLTRTDPASAARARARYSCLDHFGIERGQLAPGFEGTPDCAENVVTELTELRLREAQYMQRKGRVAADEFFCAEQNAVVIKNAEEYYRAMFHGQVSSWNLRERHMFQTLSAVRSHLMEQNVPPKIVVWAHNSHVGDARVTHMAHLGEVSLGQLCREHWGDRTCSIGFTTFSGTVTAASEWDGVAERKFVRPAIEDSYESLFHRVGYGRFYLNLKEEIEAAIHLRTPRLQRAIGVVYRPETELRSHYSSAPCPGSSTVCCTSMRLARSNHSSERAILCGTKCLRRIRPGFDKPMTTQNHPVLDALHIIATQEDAPETYEVCASCVAGFDEDQRRLNVELGAFVRRFEIRGKDDVFRPPWLPKAETVRLRVGQEEALDGGKEVFASWVKRVRNSIPPASQWACHPGWLQPRLDG